jgi:hypothetical protein
MLFPAPGFQSYSRSPRYTGISVAYQMGTVAGGLTPAILSLLFDSYGITAVAAYLTAAGLLITVCVWLLPETLAVHTWADPPALRQ